MVSSSEIGKRGGSSMGVLRSGQAKQFSHLSTAGPQTIQRSTCENNTKEAMRLSIALLGWYEGSSRQ